METDQIIDMLNLVSTVNEKKKELENISKELYQMVLNLNEYKGKNVKVTYKTGITVSGIDVTQTIEGTLESVAVSGQNFVVKTNLPGIKNGNVRVVVLNVVNMQIKE